MRSCLAVILSLLVILLSSCRPAPADQQEGSAAQLEQRRMILAGIGGDDGVQRLALVHLATGRVVPVDPPARLLSPVAPELWPSAGWGGFAYSTKEGVQVLSWDLEQAHSLPWAATFLRAKPGGGGWAMIASDPPRALTWSPLPGGRWSVNIYGNRPTGLAWLSNDALIWPSGPALSERLNLARITLPPASTAIEPLRASFTTDLDPIGFEVYHTLLGTIGDGVLVGARVLPGEPLVYRLFVWDLYGDRTFEASWTTCSPVWAARSDDVLLVTKTEITCGDLRQPSHRFYQWNWREDVIAAPADDWSPFPWVVIIDDDRWGYINAAGDLAIVQLDGRARNYITPDKPLIYLYPYAVPGR